MTTPEEAKDVVRRWNDEGWSGGRYDLAFEIIAPTTTVHGAGGQAVGMGPQGFADLIKAWRTGFPDGYMTIDDLIVDGDLVGIRNTWHGTHTGEFYHVPPSGNWVDVTSCGIDRVVDGKVTEGWGELDMVGMMQQMGAIPRVGPGAVATGRSPTWGGSSPPLADIGLDPTETKEILICFIEALASGSADLDSVVGAVDFVDHNPAWGTTDLDSARRSMEALRRSLPDLRVEIERDNMIAERDRVEIHSVWTGTHTGDDLFGSPATGRELKWTHTDCARIAGGRIAQRWVAADMLTLMQQAGVLPAPGGQPANNGPHTRPVAAPRGGTHHIPHKVKPGTHTVGSMQSEH